MAKKLNNRPAPKAAPAKPAAARAVSNKSSQTVSRDWFSVKSLAIILAAISLILYFNTLWNGYILDDTMVLQDNMMVKQGLKGIPELLSTPHMRGYMIIPNDLYRPLSLVMFAIEYQFFGLSPAMGHFFNVLTFMGCVVMLFLFLNKLFEGKRTSIAFIAALIFAVHPIHTEVVANIKSRDELLCYFFAFWSLNLFMNYMEKGKMGQLLMGIFALFLSYISKETVISFVAIVPLIFFLYRNDDKKRAAFITGGTIVATGLFLLIRTVVLTRYDANQPGATTDFMDNALVNVPANASKLATEFLVLGKYLKLMFVPYPLLMTYSFNSIPFVGFGDAWALLSIAAYLFMAGFAVYRLTRNTKDPWAFAIIFYLATLALFSNFPFLMGAEMAERFAFFASTGFCIAAALAIEQWIIKGEAGNAAVVKSGKVLVILVPVAVIFGGMTVSRNTNWKDEYTLYKTDLEKSPNDSRLYQYLATAMAEKIYPTEPDSNKRKDMDKEAIGYLQKALTIYPDFAEAHVELGRLYERTRLYRQAVIEDSTALKLKPFNAQANNNMGSVYITLGRFAESIPYLQTSAKYGPNFRFVYLNLARSFRQVKQLDSAAKHYNLFLAFDDTYSDGQKELALVYLQAGKFDSAAVHFKKYAEQQPNDPNAYNFLGAVYLNSKKYAEAAEQFKKAISLNAGFLDAYSNLGRSYYFLGQYQAALETFDKELKLDNKNPRDVPYIAMSYQKLGNMPKALEFEALAKKFYSDFKLP